MDACAESEPQDATRQTIRPEHMLAETAREMSSMIKTCTGYLVSAENNRANTSAFGTCKRAMTRLAVSPANQSKAERTLEQVVKAMKDRLRTLKVAEGYIPP